MKRRRVPSGEKRIEKAEPGSVINFRAFVPDALARKMSDPLANATWLPLGDHTAQCATISPRRWGVPAGSGKTQAGDSFSVPTESDTSNCE